MSVWAVVLAGGSGRRMGAGKNKIFLDVAGIPAVIRSTARLAEVCDGVVLAAASGEEETVRSLVRERLPHLKNFAVVTGGAERQDSVASALAALPGDAEYVLVHDGARALVTRPVIEAALESARTYGSGVAAVPLKDTVKRACPDGLVLDTPNRSELYAVQTPQAFRTELLKKAHALAVKNGFLGTDDASLLEKAGIPVHLSRGSDSNIKLTTPVDLALAELLLRGKEENV